MNDETIGSFLTVHQFAQRSRLSERTIRREINSGRLRATRRGGRLELAVSDIESWLKSNSRFLQLLPRPSGAIRPILTDPDGVALLWLAWGHDDWQDPRMRIRVPRLRARGVPIDLVAGDNGMPRYRLASAVDVRCGQSLMRFRPGDVEILNRATNSSA
ncbi:helix-turn-helix domain-containing protein [Alsobacter sp. KACC 23698]|uniref:helix-turn-helix domain-containing protein n=1 Tax=Alsobacter sp. KACC 23698 TaxID=3149229 RepID=UPI0038783153